MLDEEEDDLSDLLLTPFQQVQVSLGNLSEKVIDSRGSSAGERLTLKRLDYFFQNIILFSNDVHHKCNIFVSNCSNTMDV